MPVDSAATSQDIATRLVCSTITPLNGHQGKLYLRHRTSPAY